MGDVRQRLAHEWQVPRGCGVALEAAVTGHRADTHLSTGAVAHADKLDERIDVDQHGRLRQPEIHRRNKTLPAREKSRFIAVFGL